MMSELEEEATEYDGYPEDIDEELDALSNADADFAYWNKMPFWSLEEAIALLLGKDPERVKWSVIRHYVNYIYSSKLCFDYAKLRTLVLRALQLEEIKDPTTPMAFIEWAEGRNLQIPKPLRQSIVDRKNDAMRDSIANDKLCSNSRETFEMEILLKTRDKQINTLEDQLAVSQKRIMELETLVWEGFDENANTYSKALAIAVEAHRSISKDWKKGSSIKKQVFGWLQEHHPRLSNEEKERIAKICNWQKMGGAPRTL